MKLIKSTPPRRLIAPAIMVAVLIAGVILPQVTDKIVLTGTAILMYIIMSVSWTLFSGPTGYVSLAPAAFFGLGIYVSAFYSEFLPLPVLMLLGGIVCFAVAVVIGAITLRLRGVYFTIFTFGLVELLRNLILWLEIHNTGKRGRFVVRAAPETVYYYFLGLLVILLLVAVIIRRSRFGKALVSIGESEDAASHVGINTTWFKILAFAISSFFMGAVGAAMATRWTYIDPTIAFDTLKSFLPVLMVVFGGMKRLAGPIIGAAVFAWLQEILTTNFASYYLISIGAIMVIAILFLPDGLVGLWEWFKDRVKNRKEAAGSANT